MISHLGISCNGDLKSETTCSMCIDADDGSLVGKSLFSTGDGTSQVNLQNVG